MFLDDRILILLQFRCKRPNCQPSGVLRRIRRAVYAAWEMETPDRIQLHLILPYKHQVGDDPQVKSHLDSGYRIVQLQRVTDREVLVTLARNSG